MKSKKEYLQNLAKIIGNYIDLFEYANKQQDLLVKAISSIPAVRSESEKNKFLIAIYEEMNSRLIKSFQKTTKINSVLMQINDIKKIIVAIKTYNVLELDKDLLPALQKQQAYVNMCQKRGAVSYVGKNCFVQTSILIKCLNKTIIKQLEIYRTSLIEAIYNLTYGQGKESTAD